ncbi:jg15968 [Pararge aegeria aegeria]|uniref:Jg15968 protein n=1 Tax=Pararge aegeria aegeria TaxID=348720 RepID=A0A8S4R1R8_9NEOP|nr:jg15968 [Pararge aegeria aegeria]
MQIASCQFLTLNDESPAWYLGKMVNDKFTFHPTLRVTFYGGGRGRTTLAIRRARRQRAALYARRKSQRIAAMAPHTAALLAILTGKWCDFLV